jgi:hypothetical protein
MVTKSDGPGVWSNATCSKKRSIPAGVNITRTRAGPLADVLEAMWGASGHKHERARGRAVHSDTELETERALKHVPQFILVSMLMQWGALARRDHVFKCGQGAIRLIATSLKRERSADRPFDRFASTGGHDQGLGLHPSSSNRTPGLYHGGNSATRRPRPRIMTAPRTRLHKDYGTTPPIATAARTLVVC